MQMEYTLYHFPWSLFSLTVRYTIALRGEPTSLAGEMKIVEKVVNLQRDENLAEGYLLGINPKGQVRFVLATRNRLSLFHQKYFSDPRKGSSFSIPWPPQSSNLHTRHYLSPRCLTSLANSPAPYQYNLHPSHRPARYPTSITLRHSSRGP